MIIHNEYRKEDDQELVVEDRAVLDDQGKYIRIDWYAVDPHPEESWFDTIVGPCPKTRYILDGEFCVRTDFSILSKS